MAKITKSTSQTADKSLENVAKFRCLGTTLTHQNCVKFEKGGLTFVPKYFVFTSAV
jgi:hypothetical protein